MKIVLASWRGQGMVLARRAFHGLSGDNFEWPRSENGKSREWEIIKFGFPPDSSLDHLNGTIGPQNRHSQ